MGSYSASYIKNKSLGDLTSLAGGERKLQLIFGQVKVFPDSPWLVCRFRDGAGPPADDVLWGNASLIEQESKTYGEMIFVYSDVSADSFVFEHAREGVLLRKLVWFPMLDDDWTPGWLCAQGEPEPWEADFFFRPEALRRTIEEERSISEFQDQPESFASLEAEIRHIWETRTITAMTRFPKCDGTVAIAVERIFGIRH